MGCQNFEVTGPPQRYASITLEFLKHVFRNFNTRTLHNPSKTNPIGHRNAEGLRDEMLHCALCRETGWRVQCHAGLHLVQRHIVEQKDCEIPCSHASCRGTVWGHIMYHAVPLHDVTSCGRCAWCSPK